MKICKILRDNGVDFSNLKISKTVAGKQRNIILSEIEQEGVDIEKIIEENGLDGNFKIGLSITSLRRLYNDKRNYKEIGNVTELRKIMEELGIVSVKKENLTELVEQSKATQEKVEEAKKLESMYEQELEGKEQKEGSDMGDDSK